MASAVVKDADVAHRFAEARTVPRVGFQRLMQFGQFGGGNVQPDRGPKDGRLADPFGKATISNQVQWHSRSIAPAAALVSTYIC
ncbi:MAG: hypothetical protein QOE48_1817 [Mycobacterium sp.]|nr:hypothetical protein [Mycobacterium sp.]MDT5274336.1 hypothetical protein [Mycobacterium sp.]MDT5306147.1 hypothetical protein [Mycobacterium sp.]